MLDLYKNIKRLRVEKGLSQEELAKRVGYSDRTSITKIENGKVDLSQSKIMEFAKALGVSPAYLMGWYDDPLTESEILDLSSFFREYGISIQLENEDDPDYVIYYDGKAVSNDPDGLWEVYEKVLNEDSQTISDELNSWVQSQKKEKK